MDLIIAKCPDCGADLKIPEGSLNVTCEYCGSDIVVADVLGSDAIMQNCMRLAYAAIQGKNYIDAYNNFNEALEQNSTNYSAWYGKAVCTGMLSSIEEVRFNEMIVLIENAFKNVPADKQLTIRRTAAAEIAKAAARQKPLINAAEQLLKRIKSKGKPPYNAGSFATSIAKAKEEINKALIKAHEYDDSNNRVKELLDWIDKEIHKKRLLMQKNGIK